MDNGTDRTVVSMLNVLNLVMELWLCERMSFLGNILKYYVYIDIEKDKGKVGNFFLSVGGIGRWSDLPSTP